MLATSRECARWNFSAAWRVSWLCANCPPVTRVDRPLPLGRGDLAPLGPDDVEELAALLDARSYRAEAVLSNVGEFAARVRRPAPRRVEPSRDVSGRRVVLQVPREATCSVMCRCWCA